MCLSLVKFPTFPAYFPPLEVGKLLIYGISTEENESRKWTKIGTGHLGWQLRSRSMEHYDTRLSLIGGKRAALVDFALSSAIATAHMDENCLVVFWSSTWMRIELE